MAVPSRSKKTLVTASAGYGKAYYNLMLAQGRDLDDFTMMCQGADLASQGAQASSGVRNVSAATPKDCDELRKIVTSFLFEKLSKLCTSHRRAVLMLNSSLFIDETSDNDTRTKLPRTQLQSILLERGYIWQAPTDWSAEMGGSQDAIYDTILSSNAAPLKATLQGLQDGKLLVVKNR
jgi:hypothetical protein